MSSMSGMENDEYIYERVMSSDHYLTLLIKMIYRAPRTRKSEMKGPRVGIFDAQLQQRHVPCDLSEMAAILSADCLAREEIFCKLSIGTVIRKN